MIIAGSVELSVYGASTGINVVDVTPTGFSSEFVAQRSCRWEYPVALTAAAER